MILVGGGVAVPGFKCQKQKHGNDDDDAYNKLDSNKASDLCYGPKLAMTRPSSNCRSLNLI